MSLIGTPNHIEDNEIEMLIIASISTLKRSVYNIKKKCQDDQSIWKIKTAFNVTDLFSFDEITEYEIRKEISKLDSSKTTLVGDVPAEMLKSTIDVHVSLLTSLICQRSLKGSCTSKLKISWRASY